MEGRRPGTLPRSAATGEACAAAGGLPRASGLPPNTPLRLLMLTALRRRGTVQADTLAEAKSLPRIVREFEE